MAVVIAVPRFRRLTESKLSHEKFFKRHFKRFEKSARMDGTIAGTGFV
jgi:hypothetical protein